MARRTLYALIKTGVHGTSGLNPRISYRIYQVYVIPRLFYSLDVLPLTDTHISQLQRFHTSTLRRLQSLPERTASSIVHLLLGALSIQAELHKRQLSLLHSIARSENSRIKCLMGRQLTLQCQKSFFCKAEKILEMYDRPRSAELHNYSKLAWKKLTSQAVNRYWTQTLTSEARTKSTLANCDVTTLAIENTHIVWEAASNNVHDVRRSIPKVRMLGGVYMLQTNKVRFNQYKVEDTCPLCRLEPEDLSHMLLRCPALADVREAPLSDIRGLVTREYGSHLWSSWSRSTLVAVLIDSHNLKARVPVLLQLEALSRRYCYRLHSKKLQLHRKLLN